MRKHAHYQTLPIVYSCSGCSNAAQLANHVAVRLDREGLAEMSCTARAPSHGPDEVTEHTDRKNNLERQQRTESALQRMREYVR